MARYAGHFSLYRDESMVGTTITSDSNGEKSDSFRAESGIVAPDTV